MKVVINLRTLLIYNPWAGGGKSFTNKLDYLIHRFQEAGQPITPFRLNHFDHLPNLFQELSAGDFAKVLIAGGDGTVHQCINSMLKNDWNLPIGIYPAGTANDFFQNLGLPKSIEKLTDILVTGKTRCCDIGKANQQYFINVASLGFFIDISQRTDPKLKSNLGVFAYYMKGLEELQGLHPAQIEITSPVASYEVEAYFLLVMNGQSAGGFKRMAPRAAITDGLLDVFVFKSCPFRELMPLLLQIFGGEHAQSPYVDFFQTPRLTIQCEEPLGTDLDGESGVAFPMEIRVVPQALQVICSK
jgi:YegS/Rv2252/BmrU family lipid kinase